MCLACFELTTRFVLAGTAGSMADRRQYRDRWQAGPGKRALDVTPSAPTSTSTSTAPLTHPLVYVLVRAPLA